MALFEGYERRIDEINSVLKEYGINSIEECKEILGTNLVSRVENSLKSKGIDEHTTMRVLDYLALHELSFPYINIEEHAKNLCDNMRKSICIFNISL